MGIDGKLLLSAPFGRRRALEADQGRVKQQNFCVWYCSPAPLIRHQSQRTKLIDPGQTTRPTVNKRKVESRRGPRANNITSSCRRSVERSQSLFGSFRRWSSGRARRARIRGGKSTNSEPTDGRGLSNPSVCCWLTRGSVNEQSTRIKLHRGGPQQGSCATTQLEPNCTSMQQGEDKLPCGTRRLTHGHGVCCHCRLSRPGGEPRAGGYKRHNTWIRPLV